MYGPLPVSESIPAGTLYKYSYSFCGGMDTDLWNGIPFAFNFYTGKICSFFWNFDFRDFGCLEILIQDVRFGVISILKNYILEFC